VAYICPVIGFSTSGGGLKWEAGVSPALSP